MRNLNHNSLVISIIPALTERKKENSLDGKFMQGRGKLSKGSGTGKCESVHIKEDINSRIGGGRGGAGILRCIVPNCHKGYSIKDVHSKRKDR